MKKNFTYYIYCLLVVSTVGLTKLQAQINISVGNTVTENFDGIGVSATVTLPTGWKMSKNNTVRSVDAYSSAVTVTERIAGDNMANNAQNGMYNFGAGDPSSATDRALGGISSGSLSKSVNIYLDLYNNGAGAINDFSISYNVEKYRDGINSAGFSIQMYYSTDGSNWTSAGNDFLTSFAGGDANNNGYASAPGATVSVIGKTLNVSLAASSHLYLAWNYSVASGSTTSNAQALGIDDVIITANSPEEDKPVEVWRGGSFVSDHLTIQAGIGGAQDGDEVRVADGIYEEIVVLNKPNITLKSVNGRDHTIIKCPVTNLDPDNEDNKATLDNLNGIAAQKDMGTITVDGFTVQGFPGGIIQSMGNATGTKFVVINNKVTPYVYNVEEYLRNGIQVTGDNSLVENNEVVVGIYYNDEYGSSGIGVVNANNITVKDNTLTGGYGFGISITNWSKSLVQDITVEGNTIEFVGENIEIYGYDKNKKMKNIKIENNTILNSEESNGIVFYVSIEDLFIKHNAITGEGEYGILFDEEYGELSGTIEITENDLSGTFENTILNELDFTINATCNWWGTTNETEIKDKIQGDVIYFPYKIDDTPDSCLKPSFKLKIKKSGN